jgi:hypothetical protein
MRFGTMVAAVSALSLLVSVQTFSQAQETSGNLQLKLVDIGPTGIAIKRPVFAGACKACPWGVLALVTHLRLRRLIRPA